MIAGLNLNTVLPLCALYFVVTFIYFANGESSFSAILNTPLNASKDAETTRCKLVKPIIYDKRLKTDITYKIFKGHHNPDYLAIFLSFDNEELILDLVLNKQLIPEGYFRKIQENGITTIDKPSSDNLKLCHYTGTVRSRINSWIAISTCGGLSGIIHNGTNIYYIEKKKDGKDNEHLIYDKKDLIRNDNTTCGSRELKKHDINKLLRVTRDKRNVPQNSTIIRGPHSANTASRYLELVLVVDNKKYVEMNSSVENIEHYCKDVANIVHGLYLPLNIFVALVGVVIWTEHDEIDISEDGEKTLSNFLRYRREKLVVQHPNDNAQLITKQSFRNGVLGKALKGPICTFEFSGGVSSDNRPFIGALATTVAHMIGHNLGMEHDIESCQCPDAQCIMSSKASATLPTHWSSCSIESLRDALAQGMDHCLKNRPTSLFKGPVCGNGFLEDGEECDCGLPEYCTNQCCNPQTCMLMDNATCATGKCCDLKTCNLKNPGIICRRAANECDLSEYCTGKSEYCPGDVYRLNGEICKDGNGYCYQGFCGSHSDQCKVLWGPTGETANQICYNLNVKGNRRGHCGYNHLNQTFYKCDEEDVGCGTLQCKHLNERLEYGLESVAKLSHTFINSKGLILPCRTAIVDLGLDSSDPGMVPNGAKCGEDKMCVNQKCVLVASVREKHKCPYDCYNNGFCNNLGNCHCDTGFLLPYCQYLAPGGSVDSGPAYVFSEGIVL